MDVHPLIEVTLQLLGKAKALERLTQAIKPIDSDIK